MGKSLFSREKSSSRIENLLTVSFIWPSPAIKKFSYASLMGFHKPHSPENFILPIPYPLSYSSY